MSEIIMILIIGVLLVGCGALLYALCQKEAEHREEKKELEEKLKNAEERINVQFNLLQQMETGDSVDQFNTSVDILHQLAKK